MNDKYLGFRICSALRCKFNLPKRLFWYEKWHPNSAIFFWLNWSPSFYFAFILFFFFSFFLSPVIFPFCAVHVVVKTKFHVGVWPTLSKNYTKMSACSTIFFPNCVNNKMLEHDWLLAPYLCLNWLFPVHANCPIWPVRLRMLVICNRTGQIGQLSSQLKLSTSCH